MLFNDKRRTATADSPAKVDTASHNSHLSLKEDQFIPRRAHIMFHLPAQPAQGFAGGVRLGSEAVFRGRQSPKPGDGLADTENSLLRANLGSTGSTQSAPQDYFLHINDL